MTITILKIDFRKGERRECSTCPVALGCLRAARQLGYDKVAVSQVVVDFWQGGARYGTLTRRDLPTTAQLAIAQFDDYARIPRSHFEPFEFEIEDLPRVEGNVFTIPGQYAVDPKSRKATRRLRKFVVTGANGE